jgi:hypothetical protein
MSKGKIILLLVCLLAAGGLTAWNIFWRPRLEWLDVPDDPLARLDRVPDLSPQLRPEEVLKCRVDWHAYIGRLRGIVTPDDEFDIGARRVWQLLAPELSGATKVELFSLFPSPHDYSEMKSRSEEEQRMLKALPTFDKYPILGSVTIDRTDEAAKWVLFLQAQISPGSASKCFFNPRHGFRFTTPHGTVDLIMCFQCGDMSLDDRTSHRLVRKTRGWEPDTKDTMRLSSFVCEAVNALFDKQGIKRDIPPALKGDSP